MNNANLKRHRKQKMYNYIDKYRDCLHHYCTLNDICNCICCDNFFNGRQMDVEMQNEVCEFRSFVSAQLDPIWGDIERTKGNDLNTDLLNMVDDFEEYPHIQDLFTNFVKDMSD